MSIKTMAERIAAADYEIGQAEARHSASEQTASEVEARLAEKRDAVARLREDYQAGGMTAKEAGALASVLEDDIRELHAIAEEQREVVRRASEAVSQARANRAHLDRELGKSTDTARFRALHDRAKEIEVQFHRALSELSGLAASAGIGNAGVLHSFYSVSETTRRLTQGVVPGVRT